MPDIFDSLDNSQGGVATATAPAAPDIFDHIDSAPKENIIQNIGRHVKEVADYDYHNVWGPVAQNINARAFGTPKYLLNKASPDVANTIFPEPTDMMGKIASGVATVHGSIVGPGALFKLATKSVAAVRAANVTKEAQVFENASGAINSRLKALGGKISDWHKGPGGGQLADANDVKRILQELPEAQRDAVLLKNTSGLVDAAGKPIYRLRDLQGIRNDVGQAIKEASYSSSPGSATQSQLISVERGLKGIINNKGDAALKAMDEQYGTFDRTAAEIRGALKNNKGNVVSKPLENIIKTNDPAVMSRLNKVAKDIPEVNAAIKAVKNRVRAAQIKKHAVGLAEKAGGIFGLGGVIKKVF